MLLPAPLGPTSATVSPGADVQREVGQRMLLRPRRVVEADLLEAHRRAAARGRQRHRLRRVGHRRARGQQFHQPLGGAGGAQQVAVDLADSTATAPTKMMTKTTVCPRWPALVRAGQHRLRALVQAPQQGAEGGGDHEGHQQRAHAAALARGLEGVFGAAVETRGLARFLHVALHHRNLAQHLGGDGAGIGHAVLAGAAELAHAAAEIDAGQHHQHQHAQHLRHDPGVGDDERRPARRCPSPCCAGPCSATSPPPSAPAWCRWSGATAPRRSWCSRRTPGSAAAHGRRRRCAGRR